MAQTAERAMQLKMEEVFKAAGKTLKFFRKTLPLRWVVIVDGKALSDCYSDEWRAFQEALDRSGIGGKISFYFSEARQGWVFRYTAKKAARVEGSLGFGKYANTKLGEVPASYRQWLASHLNVLNFSNRKAAEKFLAA